jgi:hypothetical protein
VTTSPQPASGHSAARQLASQRKAKALHTLQQQAALATTDPYTRWQQLLAQEQELQALEAAMCGLWNIRWSTATWQLLHDRSERLANDMAACIASMGAGQ